MLKLCVRSDIHLPRLETLIELALSFYTFYMLHLHVKENLFYLEKMVFYFFQLMWELLVTIIRGMFY